MLEDKKTTKTKKSPLTPPWLVTHPEGDTATTSDSLCGFGNPCMTAGSASQTATPTTEAISPDTAICLPRCKFFFFFDCFK